jgi:hypothetical protein
MSPSKASILFLALAGASALGAAAGVPASAADPAAVESVPPASLSKNAKLAMSASALFPGLGQLYNEEGVKTLVISIWESYYVARILKDGQQADFYRRRAAALAPGETWHGLGKDELRARFHRHEEREVDAIWYCSALFLASILDAYVFAHLYSHQTDDLRGPKSSVLPCVGPGSSGLGIQWRVAF